MTPIHIPKGARIYLGAPAQPMPLAISDALKALAGSVPGIAEAHLPQCFVEGTQMRPSRFSSSCPCVPVTRKRF